MNNFIKVVEYRNNKKINNYQKNKERIREQALDFQNNFSCGAVYYWSELAERQLYFEKQGKRYGLLTEFRENCII